MLVVSPAGKKIHTEVCKTLLNPITFGCIDYLARYSGYFKSL